jgi:hypothetical protein
MVAKVVQLCKDHKEPMVVEHTPEHPPRSVEEEVVYMDHTGLSETMGVSFHRVERHNRYMVRHFHKARQAEVPLPSAHWAMSQLKHNRLGSVCHTWGSTLHLGQALFRIHYNSLHAS